MPNLPSTTQDILDSIYGLITTIPEMLARFWAVEVGLAVALAVVVLIASGRHR